MDQKTYFSLVSRLNKLRKEVLEAATDKAPPTVAFLGDELAKTSDPLDRATLYQLLSQEYALAGLIDDELNTMRKAAEEFPEEPVPWIGLAARLSQDQGTISEAREVIERGLQIALKTDRFIRYALGARARIANALGDQKLLEETVQILITDSAKKRMEDCGFETDFLDAIPANAIDCEIRDHYLQIAHARGANRGK